MAAASRCTARRGDGDTLWSRSLSSSVSRGECGANAGGTRHVNHRAPRGGASWRLFAVCRSVFGGLFMGGSGGRHHGVSFFKLSAAVGEIIEVDLRPVDRYDLDEIRQTVFIFCRLFAH